GGAAGALPPVVAWAAVTGSAPLAAWTLFAVIFLWTPPHFWALALFRSEDYARAGVPMMPVVHGERSTRRQIFGYAIIVALAGLAPSLLGFAGPVYAATAAALGVWFVVLAWRVLRNEAASRAPEKRLFGFSILYLFGVFSALFLESAFTLWQGATP
ncbi:MAG: UbiA family prenyltransferase, partial [Parvularculaceae bacterium]|nr:UbiA family prenyltransferase [Parvularculaceae bacterium]